LLAANWPLSTISAPVLTWSNRSSLGGFNHASSDQNLFWKGAKELFDVLEQRKADVESILRGVNSFVTYTLARSGDGGFSVTVCKDKAGIDESVQKG
jgi:hypothetical protein